MQSTYRQGHSIETALLRVYNDMLLAVDKGKEVVLILLDYSAAFDTINHDVFLTRLAERYGITGSVLRWFSTYFHNRSQYVSVNGTLSKPHTHTIGGCTSRISHCAIVLYHVHSTIGGYNSCTWPWPNDLCWWYASIYCSWWWFWPRFTYS